MSRWLTQLSVFTFALHVIAATALANPPKGEGFRLHLTTAMQNRYGASMMLNVGNIQLDQLPAMFADMQDEAGNSILPDASQPMQVVIIVPKGAKQSVREKTIADVRASISGRYPNHEIIVKESFVDLKEDDETLEHHERQIQAIEASLPEGTLAHDIATVAHQQVRDGLAENRELRKSWGFFNPVQALSNSHPYAVAVAAQGIAALKFSVSFVVVVSKYGLSLNPLAMATIASSNLAGVGIAVTNGTVGALFGYNAIAWSQFCTSHQFPWFKDNALVAWYNRNGWFKSANINLWRSLGISFALRYLAFLSGQTVSDGEGGRVGVSSPMSWEFFAQGLGIAGPEVLLDGAMDDGIRALQLKGYLNHQSRSYIYWAIGLVDTTMHTLFRAGAVKAAYTVAVVSWASKITVWGLGKYLPSGPARMVFISQDVGTTPVNAAKPASGGWFSKVTGFFKYLVANTLKEFWNWRTGNYTVSDQTLVSRDNSLNESFAVSGALSEGAKKRINTDLNLSQDDFNEMLNLADADRSFLNALWELRNRALVDSALPMTFEEFTKLVLGKVTALPHGSKRSLELLYQLRQDRIAAGQAGPGVDVTDICVQAIGEQLFHGKFQQAATGK